MADSNDRQNGGDQRQPASIFNDVIGPVMIGPSSSHTAASVRIGRLIRDMVAGTPRRVRFTFSRQGALAATYLGQGSALGLAAGLLNKTGDDPTMVCALDEIESAGIALEFRIDDSPCPHPNAYAVEAEGDQNTVSALIVSTGGGMIEMREIDGIPVLFTGGCYEHLFFLGALPAVEVQKKLITCRDQLAGLGCSYQRCLLFGNEDVGYLLDVRSTAPLPTQALPPGFAVQAMTLRPVLPVLSQPSYPGLFRTGKEILDVAKAENLAPWEMALKYEMLRGGLTKEQVWEAMARIVRVLQNTLELSAAETREYSDRVLPRQAYRLSRPILPENKLQQEVIRCITLMMEAKSSMKVIVAAPTAGSCGVVPGTLFGVAQVLHLPDDELIKAFLVAGLLGVVIAERASFAGEIGGCQAECGSASGMAAAGLTQMLGGNVEQTLDAASMALQNVLGLSCDPVADRVEVPCLGKNILCGCNALSMATLALAGFDKVVPLDETVAALAQTEELLPDAMCCTGRAGLSVTATSAAIWQRLNSWDA